MHDEIAVRMTFLGDLNKLVQVHTATPGYYERSA